MSSATIFAQCFKCQFAAAFTQVNMEESECVAVPL